MYRIGLQLFHRKRPHLLLWVSLCATRGKVTVSAAPNFLNYCEIFIVHTQFTNVVLGCIVQPGESHAAHGLLVGDPWCKAISHQPWLSICIQFYQPWCLVLYIHIHFYFFGYHGKYGDFHIGRSQGCTDMRNKFPSFCSPTVVCILILCVFISILILKMLLLTKKVLVFSEWACNSHFADC
jgi:hypothetical protein